jgi:stage III sporulation protein AD
VILTFDYLNNTFAFFNELINRSGIDKDVFRIILKVISVSFLVEFGAGTIEDFGLKGLSSKLVLIGKFVILGLSLPIIYSVFNMFYGLLS